MQASTNLSPEKRAEMIAALEKRLSDPRFMFLACLSSGIFAGMFFGLCFSWAVGGGWQGAVITGIPFGLVFVMIGPVLAQHVLAIQLPALKEDRKTSWIDFIKPSPVSGKVLGYFVLSLVIGLLLEASLGKFICSTKHSFKYSNDVPIESFKPDFIKATLGLCEVAVTLNPAWAEAYSSSGYLYGELGQNKQAVEAYTNAIHLKPQFSNAYGGRAIAYIYLKEDTKAVDDCSKAISLNPGDSVAYYNRGLAYSNLNKPSKAVDDYTNSISLDPKHVDSYINRAGCYIDLKQYQKAIDDCNAAININNGDCLAHCHRGDAYGHMKNYNKAIDDFTKTIEINPKSGCYLARAYYYGELGQYQKAVNDCNTAISLNLKPVDAYVNRGNIRVKMGQLKQAITDYTQAIALDSKYGASYYQRAKAYEKLGLKTLSAKDKMMTAQLKYKAEES